MSIDVQRNELRIDDVLSISVQRTQRLGHAITGEAPSRLGLLPLHRVDGHPALPERVRSRGGFFVPLGRDEALWLGFNATRPRAIRVAVGDIDPVAGGAWRPGLSKDPALNFIVSPPPQFL